MKSHRLVSPTVPTKKILTTIIPVHNYLERQSNILNILDQIEMYSNFIHVVFVFSGSNPDADWKLLEIDRKDVNSLAEHAFLANSSPGEARNLGVSLCKTTWITFWDDDDVPSIDSILSALLEIHPDKILVGQYAIRDLYNDHMRINAFTSDKSSLLMYGGLWRIVFPFEFVKKLTFPALNLAEDRFFILLACTNYAENHFIYSEDIFYIYQRSAKSLMTTYSSNDAIKILDLLMQYWKDQKGNSHAILLISSLCASYFYHLPLKLHVLRIFLELVLKRPRIVVGASVSVLFHNLSTWWKLRS